MVVVGVSPTLQSFLPSPSASTELILPRFTSAVLAGWPYFLTLHWSQSFLDIRYPGSLTTFQHDLAPPGEKARSWTFTCGWHQVVIHSFEQHPVHPQLQCPAPLHIALVDGNISGGEQSPTLPASFLRLTSSVINRRFYTHHVVFTRHRLYYH